MCPRKLLAEKPTSVLQNKSQATNLQIDNNKGEITSNSEKQNTGNGFANAI